METENVDVGSHPEVSQQSGYELSIQTDANTPTGEHRIIKSKSSDVSAQSQSKKRGGKRRNKKQEQVGML